MVSEQIKQQRKEMRQQILDWIKEEKDFARFFTHVEVVFMHLGFQYRQGPQTFLETRNWTTPSRKNDYIKEIEEFLEVYVK